MDVFQPPDPARGTAPARAEVDGDAVPGPPPGRRPEPLDPPMVPYAVGGTVAWAVAGLVLLFFRDWLAGHGRTDWLWICLAGFALGLVGVAVMIRHDAHRRR